MKKFAALLTALLLAVSATALADAYDKPILFRGLQWGSSYARIAEEVSLKDLDTESGLGSVYFLEDRDSLNTASGTECYASYRPSLPKAGGYPPQMITLFFAAVPDEDGYLPKEDGSDIPAADPERTKLYAARYYLDIDDEAAAYEDLSKKLSSLYGEPGLSGETMSVWYGAENTAVSLMKRYSSAGNLCITYVCADGDEWLGTAQAALKKEFSEDTDGL